MHMNISGFGFFLKTTHTERKREREDIRGRRTKTASMSYLFVLHDTKRSRSQRKRPRHLQNNCLSQTKMIFLISLMLPHGEPLSFSWKLRNQSHPYTSFGANIPLFYPGCLSQKQTKRTIKNCFRLGKTMEGGG